MKLPLITLAAFAIAPGHLPTHISPQLAVVCFARCARTGAAPTVTGVSVVSASGHADVVIGVQSPIETQDFTLDTPYRVVVDIKGASLSGTPSVYDRVPRGGITDVRVSQFTANVVRVVLQLDGAHPYELKRSANEIRISVSGGSATFAAWTGLSGRDTDVARDDAAAS
ncbi:MAG TPA: AMIN domain-containing protein, partial [Gemmatimonadaceae bacterium]